MFQHHSWDGSGLKVPSLPLFSLSLSLSVSPSLSPPPSVSFPSSPFPSSLPHFLSLILSIPTPLLLPLLSLSSLSLLSPSSCLLSLFTLSTHSLSPYFPPFAPPPPRLCLCLSVSPSPFPCVSDGDFADRPRTARRAHSRDPCRNLCVLGAQPRDLSFDIEPFTGGPGLDTSVGWKYVTTHVQGPGAAGLAPQQLRSCHRTLPHPNLLPLLGQVPGSAPPLLVS